MPLDAYFHGKGRSVAASMKKRYGDRWQRVFYATANRTGQAPKKKKRKRA